jgi:hypothetical protein
MHVLALLIWGEFAECVLDPAKEDLAAPRIVASDARS